jgi:DNA-binding MarR family transcriptional regulator
LQARNQASNIFASKDEQVALQKYLLFMDALRAVRRTMPIQHAYTFLLVAMEGGLGVQEYAKRAGVSQAVMTRILFALGSHSQGRRRGYGLVQQGIDTEDARKHQTFLNAKGKQLMREIVRLLRSDRTKLRTRHLSPIPVARDQWLSRLSAAGRKLDDKDLKLAVHLVESLMRFMA